MIGKFLKNAIFRIGENTPLQETQKKALTFLSLQVTLSLWLLRLREKSVRAAATLLYCYRRTTAFASSASSPSERRENLSKVLL